MRRSAQPRGWFGLGSTRKRGRQLCMHCASASRCTAPIPCNWCLLISSWLRPALVLDISQRRPSICPKPSGSSSELRPAALLFSTNCIGVWGCSVLLKGTLRRLCTTWQTISTFGRTSIEASGGYFHMADVFFHQNKVDIANSLYTEVTSAWHSFLLKSLQAQQQVPKSRPETSVFTEDREVSEEPLTEAQQVEGIRVLNAIVDIREQAPTQQPGETARVLHALAMLHYLLMDVPKARELGLKAFELLKQLPQQESPEPLGHLLTLMNVEPSATK
ncbi:zinc finger MYND domain-containing protein 12 isoform 4-T4 [Amazona ochrocephala]